MKLKITTIGNSAGVVLPKDLLARLRLKKGDALYVTETADGIQLSPYDPSFDDRMRAAEEIMRDRRELLHRLADS